MTIASITSHRKIYSITLLLAACFLLSAAAESPYGVCAHLNRMPPGEMRRELAGIAAAGIGFVRVDLDWAQVEPEPGKWDFSRWDAVVEEAAGRKVKVLPILGSGLPAYGKPPFRNLQRYLTYVEKCVRRYKGKINCYEVFNEVNHIRPWGETPNPANYVALLRETRRTIKRIDPEAKVLFSGVSCLGNSLKFVEEAFQAGAGDHFDVMNFHPYQWYNAPEAQLPLLIRELRMLMKKHHIDKPIWITEIGDSSSPVRYRLAEEVVSPALRKLGFRPERDTVGTVADPDTLFFTGDIDDFLPEWKRRRALTFEELRTVSPTDCPILVLPGRELFPAARIDAVTAYVRKGGTLVLPGGFPLYYDFRQTAEPDQFRTVQIGNRLLPQLHLEWEAFWVKKGVPRTTTATEAGEEFPGLKLTHHPGMRFLNAENLKGADRMIPIAWGINGRYRMPIAALYQLNSDLKGNIIVAVDSRTDSVTEKEQARRLPRQLLLAFAEGVEKVFYYRYRAGEWNRGREAHFGILRRNFEIKPAGLACQTLIRNLPPGSTRPEIFRHGLIREAHWRRPDGVPVTALWTVFGEQPAPQPGRQFLRAETLTGEPLPTAKVPDRLSADILYFTGSGTE